jgi:hypothetical protein
MKPEGRKKFEALMTNFAEEEKRYNAEKKEIEKDAKKLERERDVNAPGPYFDFGEALLQIPSSCHLFPFSHSAPCSSSACFWLSSSLAHRQLHLIFKLPSSTATSRAAA